MPATIQERIADVRKRLDAFSNDTIPPVKGTACGQEIATELDFAEQHLELGNEKAAERCVEEAMRLTEEYLDLYIPQR